MAESIGRTCRRRWLLMSIWNPCQVATQNVDHERCSHEDCSYPEAPVAMHPSPVRARIGLTAVVAIPFGIVFVSSHTTSISAGQLQRRPLLTIGEDAAVSPVKFDSTLDR